MSAAPILNATVWCSQNPGTRTARVASIQEIKLDDGEFVIESYNGFRTIGRLTGRTRRFFRMDCPTIVRYQIETVVIDGAIWGVRGERIEGTWVIRPDMVTA